MNSFIITEPTSTVEGRIGIAPNTPIMTVIHALEILNGRNPITVDDVYDFIEKMVEDGRTDELEPLLEVFPFDVDLDRLEGISTPLMAARLESTPTARMIGQVFNNCTFYNESPIRDQLLENYPDED